LIDQPEGQFKILKAKAKTKFSVIELFAGAGGLALGLENAGLKTQLLVEIDKNAAATLRQNRPRWEVIEDDVAKVDFQGSRADILTGGFPCQAFSYAGKKLGFEDIRGTLFFEYARAVQDIQPSIIVAENVRGLEKHDQGRTLQTMLLILGELGYRVDYRVLRAQYLDVPQKRERLVIIGVRKECDLDIFFPKEQDYTISLREALVNVPQSPGQKYTPTKKKVMELVPPGGYWRDLPLDIQKSFMGRSFFLGGGKTGMARRLSWNEPSLTLTCNPAQKQTERCHPSETRPLTTREYAWIQSFPDVWEFIGSTASQYKQIGNAVPVNLGYHIGRCLVAMLYKEFDSTTMIMAGLCQK
jgi:DNA (cytosine-5)-methyltransferase 1